MRRIRTVGRSDGETGAVARPNDDRAPVTSAREEAIRIAERLAELVEARRRDAVPVTPAPPRAATPEPVTTAAPVAPGGPAAPGERKVVGARHSGRLLGNLLVARGYLVDTELEHALAKQARDGGAIGEIVVELGLITDRDLVEILGEQLRMPVVDPTRYPADPAVVRQVPEAVARRLGAIALRRDGERIEVAIADPTDVAGVAELSDLLGASLHLSLATRADVDAAIARCYG